MKLIPLTSGLYAMCSDEDYILLKRWRWYPSKDKRGKTYAKCKQVGYMHRFLMQPAVGQVVDHIDGFGLNNQRENLRLCSQSENSANMPGRGGKSKYKGVSWSAARKKWLARLTVSGKVFQRYCETEVDAARAYNAFAHEHRGEYAYLNIIEEPDDHATATDGN